MLFIVLLAILVFAIQLISYIFVIPDSSQHPIKATPLDRYTGIAAYILAYTLSLLRVPLGLLPYITKLFIFFALKIRYESAQSTYFREVINMLGDFINLGITILFVLAIVGPPNIHAAAFMLYLPIGAEIVRVLTERIPIVFSAFWQLLPHRVVAHAILQRQDSNVLWKKVAHYCPRYCRYYSLGDTERTCYVLQVLKHRAACDAGLSNRLAYIQAFRIIPLDYGLRSGWVRDVARAEVYIHKPWTNDPWLLVGTAIRRAPWIFDPRYLRRPFYYMTEANRLVTLLVLEHARYCPPYAVFQFGHEIRVARLHLFYRLLRWLGVDVEEKVSADGTFQFDQFICWLEKRFGQGNASPERWYLCTDEEAIADILLRCEAGETLTAIDIASRYTYPIKYVKEVLFSKIHERIRR